MNLPDLCPGCCRSLKGAKIPAKQRHHYGGATHYHRAIYRTEYSSGFRKKRKYFVCPDCEREIKLEENKC